MSNKIGIKIIKTSQLPIHNLHENSISPTKRDDTIKPHKPIAILAAANQRTTPASESE